MVEECVEIEFRALTNERPQLHFEICSAEALGRVIGLFRELSERPATICLAERDFVKLKNIADMQLVSIGTNKEPRVNFSTERDKKVFRWVHDSEGWIQCAELVEPLTPGTHQYFDYDKPGDIEVRISFSKSRK